MKGILFVCEAGLILFDEAQNVISSAKFDEGSALRALDSLKQEGGKQLLNILTDAKNSGIEDLVVSDPSLRQRVEHYGVRATEPSPQLLSSLQEHKVDWMMKSGLVASEDEAREAVRRFAVEVSEAKLRTLSSSPDLHVTQSIQALDEVDKAANTLASRIREWYGLHFPELDPMIDDQATYARIALEFGPRDRIAEDDLMKFGFSEKKKAALLEAAARSKGGTISDEDLARISSLAQELLHLTSLREKFARHTENLMEKIAPNVTSIAGATVGARLMAKAGGLEKMAKLPASTIQILGAEKALFRAIRFGTNPPKHGFLFQHQLVHSAPKWQRGKIARSLANKIAIAARIDAFRGVKEEGLAEKLQARIDEIQRKYPQPRRVEEKQKKRGRRRAATRKR